MIAERSLRLTTDLRVTLLRKETPPASGLTPVVTDLTLGVMGDKSPKAVYKHAAQKQTKADAARQKKGNAVSAKQVPKTKK